MMQEKSKVMANRSSKTGKIIIFSLIAVLIAAGIAILEFARAPELPYNFNESVLGFVYKIDASMIDSIEIPHRTLTDKEIGKIIFLYNRSLLRHTDGGTTPSFGITIRFSDGSSLRLVDAFSGSYLDTVFFDKDGNVYEQNGEIKIFNPMLVSYVKKLCGYK